MVKLGMFKALQRGSFACQELLLVSIILSLMPQLVFEYLACSGVTCSEELADIYNLGLVILQQVVLRGGFIFTCRSSSKWWIAVDLIVAQRLLYQVAMTQVLKISWCNSFCFCVILITHDGLLLVDLSDFPWTSLGWVITGYSWQELTKKWSYNENLRELNMLGKQGLFEIYMSLRDN